MMQWSSCHGMWSERRACYLRGAGYGDVDRVSSTAEAPRRAEALQEFVATWQGSSAGRWTGLGDGTAIPCPAVQACSSCSMLAKEACRLGQASRLAADLTNVVGEPAQAHIGRTGSLRSGGEHYLQTRYSLVTAHSS